MTIHRAAWTGIALGLLALLALGAGHLALTDIHHGEGDLALEWQVLRLAAVVIVVSQAWALGVLARLARTTPPR